MKIGDRRQIVTCDCDRVNIRQEFAEPTILYFVSL